jgi:hypothetical protein
MLLPKKNKQFMDITDIENRIRDYISQNNIQDAIDLLSSSFKDDSDIDEIILQSAKFHAIRKNEILGTRDNVELEIELNTLRTNILKFIKAKKDYFKYKKRTFGNEDITRVDKEVLIRVFLSVASPFQDDQQNYIDKLKLYFKENGILLDSLTEWNDHDPLVPVLDQMRNCSGCLVLALERYHVKEGVEKRGSHQEIKIENKSYTSPWLHIETALARSLNLPLIILKDSSLINEGLIHNDKQEWGIVRINQSNIKEIEEYPVKNFILNWINQVKQYHTLKMKV